MGLNAQTAVPVFTAGQILTAEQVTQINTGVPVFATTVTRDAAFGGAGEKTLAEGQFAYIEATKATQYYNGTAWQTVGTNAAANFVSTSQTTASTTYVDLATASSVTLTTGTTALVTINCNAQNVTSGASVYMSFAISGATTTAASDTYAAWYRNSSNYQTQLSATFPVTLTAGSNTFTTKFRTDAGTGIYLSRNIAVLAI